MDFLSAIQLYLLLCAVVSLIYVCRRNRWIRLMFYPLICLLHTASHLVPPFLRRSISSSFYWLLFERNHFYQLLYILCVLAGHYVLIVRVITTLYGYSETENHLLITIACLFCNCFCYTMVCLTDPGVIHRRNVSFYSQLYAYDHAIYEPKECSTCQLVTPARSKHCARCDQCVFRFDHHCVWTNCCIGGLNYRHFLQFLVSTLAMTLNATWLSYRMLHDYAEHEHLWYASYVDRDGSIHLMDWTAITQHLLMSFPLVVTMTTVFGVVSISLLCYLGFHIWLFCSNQTSYEYGYPTKRRYSTSQSHKSIHEHIHGDATPINHCHPLLDSHFTPVSRPTRFYDRGLIANLSEVFGFRTENALRELRRRLPVQMEFRTR